MISLRFLAGFLPLCAVICTSNVRAERLSTEAVNASVLEQVEQAPLDVRGPDKTEIRTKKEQAGDASTVSELVEYYASQGLDEAAPLEDGMQEKLWQPTFRMHIDGGKDDLSGSIGIWAPLHQAEGETVTVDGINIERAADSLAYIDIEGHGMWRNRDVGEDVVDSEFSAGVGYRTLLGDVGEKRGWIAGVHAYIDGLFTETDDFMGQASLGVEARTKHASAYVTGYLPFKQYGSDDDPIDGNCAPRLGVDGGVSAHVPLINRLVHNDNYAELELYGQGYYYPDYDRVKELYGGVAGAQLTLEGTMGGLLKHYSTLEPYIEGVWDSESDDMEAKGGVELQFPLGNPNTNYRATEIDPRYHRRMRERARRNIGFGGSACKDIYYEPTAANESTAPAAPTCQSLAAEANEVSITAAALTIEAVQACNAAPGGTFHSSVDCTTNSILAESTNCNTLSNMVICVDAVSYDAVGYAFTSSSSIYQPDTCTAGAVVSGEPGICTCPCEGLSFSGGNDEYIAPSGGSLFGIISTDYFNASFVLDSVDLLASADPAGDLETFLQANGLPCITVSDLTFNDDGTGINVVNLTYNIAASCAAHVQIAIFSPGSSPFVTDNEPISCTVRDATRNT